MSDVAPIPMESIDSFVCINCSDCVRDHGRAAVVVSWAMNGAAIVRCYPVAQIRHNHGRGKVERWH
jgi:hypothetical protein